MIIVKDKFLGIKRIFFASVLFLILAPFVWTSFFVVPSADDYDYSGSSIHMGYFNFQSYLYTNWSARYIATAIQSNPLLIHFWVYRFIPLLLFIFFVHSFYKIFSEISPFNYYSKVERVCFSFAVLALYLAQIVITSNFYWLSASATYVLPLILLNYFLVCLYRLSIKNDERITNIALASILIFLIIGSDEVIMIFLDFVILVAFLFSSFKNKKIKFNWGIFSLGLVALISSSLVVFAPGNMVRAHENREIGSAIIGSLHSFFKNGYEWLFSNSIVWIIVFPFLYLVLYAFFKQRSTLERMNGYLINPLIATFLWFIFLVLCFFPHYWALGGDEGPDRTIALIQFLFYIGFFYILCTLAFFIWKRYGKRLNEDLFKTSAHVSYILLIIAVIVMFSTSKNVHMGYIDMITRESENFYDMNEQVKNMILAGGNGIIFVPGEADVPKLTSFRGKENFSSMGSYFRKNVKVVKNISLEDFRIVEKYLGAQVDNQGNGVYFDSDSNSIVYKFIMGGDRENKKFFVEIISDSGREKIQSEEFNWNFDKSEIDGYSYYIFHFSYQDIEKVSTYQLDEVGRRIWEKTVKLKNKSN